ncbi:MAG TPA: FAD-dependent oxidoreductase, partial [Longimicrobium sp.]|nr:FAD-dependent oxidoreductase [Longimicrobium sp.]
MADVAVIGAGVGGLAAATRLAARGLSVDVLEAGPRVGGKLNVRVVDGVEVDTGPSVLTLPGALDAVFRVAGSSLREEISLREPDPAFRYLYPDGVALDVFVRPDETAESVRATLGAQAADDFAAFLRYAARIWNAAAPHFVYGPAPTPATLARGGLASLALLPRIDPLRGMWGAIRARVRSPHLRWLLARYATYNGSDPRRAPATLNCIAHVELAMGGYGVQGGMYEVARALARAAERAGARIHTGARVERIRTSGGRVQSVETADGRHWPAAAVVGNGDAAHVLNDLLPRGTRRRAAPEPSMSGWVGIVRARRRTGAEVRIAHTVLFPGTYMDEFADIFDRGVPPAEPTVYLCAQEACHGRTGWDDEEPLFAMA